MSPEDSGPPPGTWPQQTAENVQRMEARRRWARLRLRAGVERELANVEREWRELEEVGRLIGLPIEATSESLALAEGMHCLLEAALPLSGPARRGAWLTTWSKAPPQPVAKVSWWVDEILTLDNLVQGGPIMEVSAIMARCLAEVLRLARFDVEVFGARELLVRWGSQRT